MEGIIIDGMEKNVNPKVKEDWNHKAFINAGSYGTNLMDAIKKIDNDPKLFEEKYNQPVFTSSQLDKLENNLGEFETWLIKIIK